LFAILNIYRTKGTVVINSLNSLLTEEKEISALNELVLLCEILEKCGFGDRISIDFSVGNDLKYYSGVVFKGFVKGVPTSVLSGGRYDNLMKKMGKASGAIGFAVYLDLLAELYGDEDEYDADVLVLYDGATDPCKLLGLTDGLVREARALRREKRYPRERLIRKSLI
jgi:ATP phosphoribosyltransferase regulatory subunit